MNKDYIRKTLGLYSFYRPSFLEGVARIFDFSQSMHLYKMAKVGVQADKKAMQSDWQMVGEDLKKSMEIYGPNK